MRRMFFALTACVATMATSWAHFVYVVPSKEAGQVMVVFSDDLEPDENVAIQKIAALKLQTLGGDKVTTVECTTGKHELKATLPPNTKIAHGTIVYGLASRGDKPALLVYHPKVLIGVSGKEAMIGPKAALEVIPFIANGKTKFQLLAEGKPVADAEGSALLPDGTKEKLKTDKEGFTAEFAVNGRVAIWLRHTIAKAGDHDGKKYEEAKHYATLVADVKAAALPPLPSPVSSLGAVVSEGYLYVYGGHFGKTHTYSTKDVLGTFHRLKLEGGSAWETLPEGPIAQGMNLVAHKGKVIRVGGMQPRNEQGQPSDNHSLASVAAYNPTTKKWEEMPALPAGRSSHDVVVVGDQLVVVGGWEQRGKGEKSNWHDTTLTLDLAKQGAKWESIPQPFKRRALTASVVGTKVYVLCGLGSESSSGRVDVLDLATKKWSLGPVVPGESIGFSPAANIVQGRLILNTLDGVVYRLTTNGEAWEKLGNASKGRMVHRLVPYGNAALLVGGASKGGNVAELEVFPIPEKGEVVAPSTKGSGTP